MGYRSFRWNSSSNCNTVVGLDLEHTDNAPDAESEDEMPRTSNSELLRLQCDSGVTSTPSYSNHTHPQVNSQTF